MNALLIIAHGSRRAASNDEVRRLAGRLSGERNPVFGIVESAFLEIADPDIVRGVEHCVNRGATRVTVVPYFLSAGRHVAEDIPGELVEAADRFPGIVIESTPHIGDSEAMAALVMAAACGIVGESADKGNSPQAQETAAGVGS